MGIIWLGLSLAGCAHQNLNQKIDRKMDAEPGTLTMADLGREAQESIQSDKTLNASQKSALMDLVVTSRGKSDALRIQSLKLRAVLIKDVMSPDYDQQEVDQVKRRIKDIEDQRLTNTFESLDRANTIMGRPSAENERILRSVYQLHGDSPF